MEQIGIEPDFLIAEASRSQVYPLIDLGLGMAISAFPRSD
jgi:hypothetical protein